MNRKTNKKTVLAAMLCLIAILTGCYREDVNTLYSRQYELSDEIKGLNAKIQDVNNRIADLYNLYNALKEKEVVSSFEYVIGPQKDTLGVNIFLDNYSFFLPFGKDGKDGRDGKDGLTPTISISNDGYWIINGAKSTIRAEGRDGATPTITISSDGYWVINGEKTNTKAQGKDGKDGADGKDGNTPTITISSDGYWVINGTKTTTKAQGNDGKDGADGKDGTTPTITISSDGYWVINGEKTNTKAQGNDGKDGADGKDGNTPTITISSDGYWVINGTKTTTKAQGNDGKDGADGKDGNTPTITISNDGYWVINGVQSDIKAIGKDGVNGTNGKDGNTPTISISNDGFWVINGEKTDYTAIGKDGANGTNGKDGADGKDGATPTITISNDGYWVINGTPTGVKAQGPKGDTGDSGEDGTTPTITISNDGYWVINGQTTTTKAVAQAPLISAEELDGVFYWTIKYPGEEDYTWLLVNGQKVQASGMKGDKGDTGEPGADGVDGEPGVESYVTSIIKSESGDQITITTKDGDEYVVPLIGMNFTIHPSDGLLKDKNGNDSIIVFSSPGQTIDIPYTSSNNVARIEAMLPSGWSAVADTSSVASRKKIHLTAPSIANLARAQFSGLASFIAFDQHGAAITQYIKIAMKRLTNISFFYNASSAIPTMSPKSVLNAPTIGANTIIEYTDWTLDTQTREYIKSSGYPLRYIPLSANLLRNYPFFSIEKEESDNEKAHIGTTFIYNPDSIRSVPINISTPDQALMLPSYNNSDYFKPIPWDTYVAYQNFFTNDGSDNIIMRLKRATVKWIISIKKPQEKLGVDPRAVDLKDFRFELINQNQFRTANLALYNNVRVVSLPNQVIYDENQDKLICTMSTLGASNSRISVNIYYKRQAKMQWNTNPGTIAQDDCTVEAHIGENHSQYPYSNYISIRKHTTGDAFLISGYITSNPSIPDLPILE